MIVCNGMVFTGLVSSEYEFPPANSGWLEPFYGSCPAFTHNYCVFVSTAGMQQFNHHTCKSVSVYVYSVIMLVCKVRKEIGSADSALISRPEGENTASNFPN